MTERGESADSASIVSRIPRAYWEIPYDGSQVPGRRRPTSVFEGANCQRYAYAVLALFGLNVPAVRSSDLWSDRSSTIRVDEPRALDLVLFGGGVNAWGAHVGVYLGGEKVLHLCKEVGLPTVWTLNEFRSKPRYRRLVGFKRVLKDAASETAQPGRRHEGH